MAITEREVRTLVAVARSFGEFFTDRAAFRAIDVVRLVYAVTAAVAFLATEVGRYAYRPYIYRNGIDDFGLADSIGNLGGIVVQIFFSLAILNAQGRKAFHVVGVLVAGYVAYEFLQPYLPKGVFDWKDVYGTIIGGAVAALLLLAVQRIVTDNRTFVRF